MRIPGAETSSHLPTHCTQRAPRGPNFGHLRGTSLSRTHEPVATGSRRCPQTQRPPLVVEGRRAGRAAGARTPPQLPWGRGPASSPCGRWWRTQSQGPSQARALQGWKSRGPLVGGQVGARGEGLWVELHLLISALLPGPGCFTVGTDLVFKFPSLRTGPGSSSLPMPLPSHLWPLTRAHWHLQLLTPAHSHLQPLRCHTLTCAFAPGPVGEGRGVCQPQDSWLEYPYFTFP